MAGAPVILDIWIYSLGISLQNQGTHPVLSYNQQSCPIGFNRIAFLHISFSSRESFEGSLFNFLLDNAFIRRMEDNTSRICLPMQLWVGMIASFNPPRCIKNLRLIIDTLCT